MAEDRLTDADFARALEIWREYQKHHDLSGRLAHEAVGIDPHTGEIWFGESAGDISQRLESQGVFRPLCFVRVGTEYYQRKGGQQWSREPRRLMVFRR